MPRELIARDTERDGTPEAPLELRDYDLNVEWARTPERDIPHDDGKPRIQVTVKHATYGPPTTDQFGTHERGNLRHSREMFSTSLTAAQVNHLIRTLRRARDAVYGTDA